MNEPITTDPPAVYPVVSAAFLRHQYSTQPVAGARKRTANRH